MALHLKTSRNSASRFLFLSGLFIFCLVIFALISGYVIKYRHNSLDNAVIGFLNHYRSPGAIRFMRWITFYGSSGFLIAANTFLALFFLTRKEYRYVVAIVTTALGGWLLQSGMKLLFHRQRPDEPLILHVATFSYPSGHSFSSAVFFSLVAFLIHRSNFSLLAKRLLMMLALFCPLLIGLSRLILNVHYATDVIGGFALAVMWLTLCYYFFERFDNRVGN